MITVVKPPNMLSEGVTAFFTTKHFLRENERMRDALSRQLDVPGEKIYIPDQRHTGTVHVLESSIETVTADAVITERKDIMIGIVVADCVPILIFDRAGGAIGAVHAGWRGTAGQILKNTIDRMKDIYGCSPASMALAVGPSIRKCDYEVGEEVRAAVSSATGSGSYYRKSGDRYMLDLSAANMIQAMNAGVARENIWQSDECTYCSSEKYFSYRYSKGSAGRQGGFIGMW